MNITQENFRRNAGPAKEFKQNTTYTCAGWGGGYSTAVKIVNLWRLTPYHVGAIKASPTSEELTDEEY